MLPFGETVMYWLGLSSKGYKNMKLDELLKEIPLKRKSKRFKRQANMSRLPHPVTFYHRMGINLKTGTTWQSVKCPFHDDKNPSMGINAGHGGYHCHGCGEKGDMLGFYMKFYQVDFMTACEQLDLFERVNS